MTRLDTLAAQWPAISELLDEALALPAAQRLTWLQTLAGERSKYTDTLRRLLAAQGGAETQDFLVALPRLPHLRATASDTDPGSGQVIGPYRLISELGRGGMGAVWLAERVDGQLKRRVALKLPRLAWGDALAERLARERDILASLEHVHIARLYDAGVDAQGRPYLAMEVVEGQPIDVYCRDRALPLRERLALLLQVAAAVAHAHAKLVVHLDLKPGNILVTAQGQVRLLDFGVAKLMAGDRTEETALTRQSGHALTLDYASPEQIRGEPLGTASDVYSLAVVAYELLSGERPYRLKRGSAAELEVAIAMATPPLASEAAQMAPLKQQLKGDLDAILNKALKKDSASRYASVEALVQDLQRHLNQQPVLAQADSLGYRAGKFMVRYRLQVAAGGLVAMALVVGTGVAFWQAHEARLQATRAANAAATAQAVQGFIESVFRANSGDQIDPEKMRATTARQLLDLGAQRIDTELRDAPIARLRLLQILALMYEDMVMLDRMLALQQKRVALARSAIGHDSDETVLALADLGHAYESLDRRDESAAALQQASAILDARQVSTSAARFRVDLMTASLYRRIDPAQGLVAADRAVRYARTQPPSADLVLALQMQGEDARYAGHADQALAPLSEAIRLIEARPELGASVLTTVYSALGETQQVLGDFDAAEQSTRKGLELERQRPGVPFLQHFAEWKLAALLFERGRLRETLDVIRPAAEWARSVKSGFGSELAMMVTSQGRALVAYGQVDEGLAALDEAVAMLQPLPVAPELQGPLLLFQAAGWIEQGRYAAASQAADEAQRVLAAAHMATDKWLPPVRRSLQVARGLSGQAGQADLALRDFQAARLQQGLSAAPLVTDKPQIQAESAWLQLAAGQPGPAQAQASQALAAIANDRHASGLRLPQARATLVLGQALLQQGQAAQALPVLQHALALLRAVYDPERSLTVADAWLALAQCQRSLGDSSAAARSVAQARRIHASQRSVGQHHQVALRALVGPSQAAVR